MNVRQDTWAGIKVLLVLIVEKHCVSANPFVFFGQLSGSSEPSKCQIFAISSYIEDQVSEYTFVCVCTNLQYHPDRLGGDCSSEAESGVKKFLEVDAAWRVLSDQTTRTQYDLQRRGGTLNCASFTLFTDKVCDGFL